MHHVIYSDFALPMYKLQEVQDPKFYSTSKLDIAEADTYTTAVYASTV
jgi:hypothetical protein